MSPEERAGQKARNGSVARTLGAILPPIRGSLPEVIRSWCAHHHHHQRSSRPFERARHAHAPPTARRRRVAGAPAARGLGAAATPFARRPLAMSHRTGAPLERGRGGGSKVLAVCHPTLALGRSSKHALHRASRAARSTRRLRHPHSSPPGDNVRSYARTQVGARARSAPAFGAERVARGSDPAATGARARSAHAIGAERVTRGDAGSASALLRSLAAPLSHPHPCTTGRLLRF